MCLLVCWLYQHTAPPEPLYVLSATDFNMPSELFSFLWPSACPATHDNQDIETCQEMAVSCHHFIQLFSFVLQYERSSGLYPLAYRISVQHDQVALLALSLSLSL